MIFNLLINYCGLMKNNENIKDKIKNKSLKVCIGLGCDLPVAFICKKV